MGLDDEGKRRFGATRSTCVFETRDPAKVALPRREEPTGNLASLQEQQPVVAISIEESAKGVLWNKKYLVLFLAIVLTVGLVALAAGCGSSTTTTAAPATTATTAASGSTTTGSAPATTATTAGGKVVSVKIGAAGPFTGALSKIGMDTLNAIKYAVDQFNTANPTIKVAVDDTGDDAADPAKSAAVAEKFSSDAAIVGVIGPMTSAGVQAALPIYEKNGLAMITQSATNDKLSQQGYTVFHRICPVDAAQGAAVAGIMGADLKAKKVYIIDDKGTYGQGLADQVTSTLKSKYSLHRRADRALFHHPGRQGLLVPDHQDAGGQARRFLRRHPPSRPSMPSSPSRCRR